MMNDKWKYALREVFIKSPYMLHIAVLGVYVNLTLALSMFLYKELWCWPSIINGVVGYVFCYFLLIRTRLKDYRRTQDNIMWMNLIDEHFREIEDKKEEDARRSNGDDYINSIDDLYDD